MSVYHLLTKYGHDVCNYDLFCDQNEVFRVKNLED